MSAAGRPLDQYAPPACRNRAARAPKKVASPPNGRRRRRRQAGRRAFFFLLRIGARFGRRATPPPTTPPPPPPRRRGRSSSRRSARVERDEGLVHLALREVKPRATRAPSSRARARLFEQLRQRHLAAAAATHRAAALRRCGDLRARVQHELDDVEVAALLAVLRERRRAVVARGDRRARVDGAARRAPPVAKLLPPRRAPTRRPAGGAS